jgi:hypothetical protein
MRKTLILTLAISVLLSACQNKQEGVKENNIKIEKVDNTEKIEVIFNEFKVLYQELLGFKDEQNFKSYGFGQEIEKYDEWLVKVKELEENPDSKLLVQKDVVAGELEQLGLAYASSKGIETEVTKSFNKFFSDAISTKPIEKIETASGNENYDKLKLEYNLFGKWEITNTTVKQSYPYEIYKKENEYIGVRPHDEFKTEILQKKGNKYYITGNKYGEYYIINTSKEMTLFDKDGELLSMGYKAVKQ